jgi:hypothetical protein
VDTTGPFGNRLELMERVSDTGQQRGASQRPPNKPPQPTAEKRDGRVASREASLGPRHAKEAPPEKSETPSRRTFGEEREKSCADS